MYASLIAAGVSQLYDLYKGVTGGSTATDTAFKPPPADDSSSPSGTKATGAVNSTGTSGGGLNDALHKLFTDLQSGSSTSGVAGSTASNPFGGLAASLLSYSKSQSLGAASTSSTSLTA